MRLLYIRFCIFVFEWVYRYVYKCLLYLRFCICDIVSELVYRCLCFFVYGFVYKCLYRSVYVFVYLAECVN